MKRGLAIKIWTQILSKFRITLYFSNLNKNQNDGVMVFINNSIVLIFSIEILAQTHTTLEILIKKYNSTFLIYVIYRSPNSNVESFVD
jgi:hypothetical protein